MLCLIEKLKDISVQTTKRKRKKKYEENLSALILCHYVLTPRKMCSCGKNQKVKKNSLKVKRYFES